MKLKNVKFPKAMIAVLTRQGIDLTYFETLNKIYRTVRAEMKIYDDTPDFPTTTSVPHGDTMSLQNNSTTNVPKIGLEQERSLVKFVVCLKQLRFADDIILIVINPDLKLTNDLNTAINDIALMMTLAKMKIVYNEKVNETTK